MEQSQDNKNTSLSKKFDKLSIQQNKEKTQNDKLKNLSLKQRQQLGINYLSFSKSN